MATITWILKDKKALTARIKKFCSELKARDLGTEFVFWNSDKQTYTPSPLVFLSNPDLVFIKEVQEEVNKKNTELSTFSSLCFVFDSEVEFTSEELFKAGIKESLSLKEPVNFLIRRLNLKKELINSEKEFLLKVKEQTTKEAKNETILKQREEFLSVCAHDLRSPLGLIQSSLSLILNNPPQNLSEFHTELLTRSKRQASQAITLVNDLLDVMAYEQGLKPHYQIINLHKFLSEFYRDYRFQAEQKNIHFHYENNIKDWRVLADGERIRQLLQNLFMNAMKFTEAHKNIYLKVESFEGRRKVDPPYPMIVVALKDEGVGIPQKEMEKIFDRFTQIKEQSRKEGRGLGLTVAKQISTLHDGNIWVESEEGKGSTFFVLFPHVMSRLSSVPHVEGKEKTILVAEFRETIRRDYFELLERWGYKLVFAKDGVEAMTYAFHYMPDLIILTENLPKMSEEEVVNSLKSENLTASIPVILSHMPANGQAKNYDNIPFDGFLRVPFTKESFNKVLDEAAKKKPVKKAA